MNEHLKTSQRTIRIGTRGSALALWQADHITVLLQTALPGITIERMIIKTEGDRDQKTSLTQMGGRGVFTKSIEDALLAGQIDVAVHSLKDLPTTMTDGLVLAATPERGPVEDILVSAEGLALDQLPEGARIASGSIRRRSQLLHRRPDLELQDLRGNIDTRLRKLKEDHLDGIIMAHAAIIRLKISGISYSVFTTEEMIPAVGQGIIGLQARAEDEEILSLLEHVNHHATFTAAVCERAFLNELDSGCQFPVGAYAALQNGQLNLSGFVGSMDGRALIRDSLIASPSDPVSCGRELACRLQDRGANDLLKEFTLNPAV